MELQSILNNRYQNEKDLTNFPFNCKNNMSKMMEGFEFESTKNFYENQEELKRQIRYIKEIKYGIVIIALKKNNRIWRFNGRGGKKNNCLIRKLIIFIKGCANSSYDKGIFVVSLTIGGKSQPRFKPETKSVHPSLPELLENKKWIINKYEICLHFPCLLCSYNNWAVFKNEGKYPTLLTIIKSIQFRYYGKYSFYHKNCTINERIKKLYMYNRKEYENEVKLNVEKYANFKVLKERLKKKPFEINWISEDEFRDWWKNRIKPLKECQIFDYTKEPEMEISWRIKKNVADNDDVAISTDIIDTPVDVEKKIVKLSLIRRNKRKSRRKERRKKRKKTNKEVIVVEPQPSSIESENDLLLTRFPKNRYISKDELVGLKRIDNGFAGDVYESFYKGQAVAVKVMRPGENEEEAKKIQKFMKKEIDAHLILKHKNIVDFIGYTELKGKVALIMEKIDGSLDRLLYVDVKESDPRLSIEQKYDILVQLAECMRYIHSQNMAHRDLRASNILCYPGSNNGLEIKVCDFGLMRNIEPIERIDTKGNIFTDRIKSVNVTNARWVPPENACIPDVFVGFAEDYYAYGCSMIEVLFGTAPFPGYSDYQVLGFIAQGQYMDYLFPQKRNNQRPYRGGDLIPQFLIDLIRKCCAKNPEDRCKPDEILEILKINKENLHE